MADSYTLTVKNRSTMAGNVCVFQARPDVNVPGVLTLAWLTKFANPGTDVEFTWGIDYSFVWSEQGELKPGIQFKASQVVPADLRVKNLVDFDYEGGFKFGEPRLGPKSGSLFIFQGPLLPPKQAMVGIGMSGNGTFVVATQPNIEAIFTPHPVYYVVFGNYQQGEVIDITEISQASRVVFPQNTYQVSKTLTGENLWVES